MAKETKQETVPPQEVEQTVEELAEEQLPTEVEAEQVPAEAPAAEAEAEAKQKRKKKEDEIVEERFYTVPLQKALIRPPHKRTPRAISLLKIFINRHMKVGVKIDAEDEEEEMPQLIITQEVNEKIWNRGIEKPPRKIKVRVTKDKDNNVTVYLAENQ
jgi:large subunit ribosomal protein L31e